MQFEGLQGLLKKKKKLSAASDAANSTPEPTTGGPEPAPTPNTPTTTPNAQETVSSPSTVAADPYAAALRSVQARPPPQSPVLETQEADVRANESRKRSRESSQETPTSDADQIDQPSPHQTTSVSHTVQPGSASTQASVPCFIDADEVLQQQRNGVAVLQACMTFLENYWTTHKTAAKGTVDVQPLPKAVGDYLAARFLSPDCVGPETGEPEMALLTREFEQLAVLADEMKAENTSHAKEEVNRQETGKEESDTPSNFETACISHDDEATRQQLAEMVRALWYLIALRWQHSLHPSPISLLHPKGARGTAKDGSPAAPVDQRGWCPHVYGAMVGNLPPEVRLTCGRVVAEELQQWRTLTRTRQFALELLAYLYRDFQTLCGSGVTSNTNTVPLILPLSLREGLHRMLVQHLQRERDYLASRQDYVDMTMGTANWKLGLFSGGEVHMRRSMERVERNRIDHLLQNEHATHLLQSVREAATFLEQQRLPISAPFFQA